MTQFLGSGVDLKADLTSDTSWTMDLTRFQAPIGNFVMFNLTSGIDRPRGQADLSSDMD